MTGAAPVRSAGPQELMATCWSSAGDAASDRADLRSPLPLRERIEAASATGFTGFGLLSDDLPPEAFMDNDFFEWLKDDSSAE